MIKLTELSKSPEKSVFNKYPYLLDIWPDHSHPEILEATHHWENTPEEQGQIYTISLDDTVIGLMGYFPISDTEFCLRWSGLSNHFRGKGKFAYSLYLLIDLLKYRYTHLYEIAYSEDIVEYFINLGFKLTEDTATINRVLRESGDDTQTGTVLCLTLEDVF